MNVNIQAVKFKADQKLESFITQKVEKLSNSFSDIIGSEVALKLENGEQVANKIVEIRLVVPSDDLFARKQAPTFEEATDLAIDALKTQISKRKEKLRG